MSSLVTDGPIHDEHHSTASTASDSDPSGMRSPTSSSPAESTENSPTTTAATADPNPPHIAMSIASAQQVVNSMKPPVAQIRKVSATALKASLTSLEAQNDEAFVFKDLVHSYSIVSRQVENGLEAVKRNAEFIGKIAKAKQAYSNALFASLSEFNKPIVPPSPSLETKSLNVNSSLGAPGSAGVKDEGSRSRSASTGSRSRSGSTAAPLTPFNNNDVIGTRANHACQTLRDVIEAEAISDARAAQAFTDTVVNPLFAYYRDAESKRKSLVEHAESMMAQLKASHDRMLQTKISVLKLLESMKFAEEREAKEKEERAKAEASGKLNEYEMSKAGKSVKSSLSFLFKNKKEQLSEALHSLSSEELREQAFQATNAYQLTVENANYQTELFYTTHLPNLLRQLQAMETQRLETLQIHLSLLAQHYNGLSQPSDQRIDSFTASVKGMATRADLEDYVTSAVKEVGLPSLPNKFVYDLNFSADDIKLGRLQNIAMVGTAGSTVSNGKIPLFGSSIEQNIEAQKESHPALNVPFIPNDLTELIRSLSEKNHNNGIFNQSVTPEELLRARAVIEDTQSFTTDSIELAASLLKMWLRDLHPRLISGDAYERALFVSKENQCEHSAVLGVYYSLNELNQRVIRIIAELSQQLVSYSATNGESYDKLALSLAPNLMQNPSNDPQQVLAAVNSEINFVAALLPVVAEAHAATAKVVVTPATTTTTVTATVSENDSESVTSASTTAGSDTDSRSSVSATSESVIGSATSSTVDDELVEVPQTPVYTQ